MTPAGLAAFEARREDRTGVYSSERPPASLEPAEEERLRANQKAAKFWDAQPPSYQRAALHWITTAKRAETRARRLTLLIQDSAAGRTVPPLTRPEKKPPGPRAAGAARRRGTAR